MSVELQHYPDIHCESCGSTNTDCSVNLGSARDYTGTDYWDEGWKCRDCGARFPVARAFTEQDYQQKVEMILEELLNEYDPRLPDDTDLDDYVQQVTGVFTGADLRGVSL